MSKMLLANPSKRRGKRRRSGSKKRKPSGWFKALLSAKKNPRRRKSSRRRSSTRTVYIRAKRNPIVPRGFMHSHGMPAIVGAVGATLNDIAIGSLQSRLPVSLQAPGLRHLIKAGTALAIGYGVDRATPLRGGLVRQGTVGALTCVLHDALRAQVQKQLPTVPMGEYLAEVMAVPQGAITQDDYDDGVSEADSEFGEYLADGGELTGEEDDSTY